MCFDYCVLVLPQMEVWHVIQNTVGVQVPGVQLKSGPYFNISNLFTKIYNMLYYTTDLYLQ
jgi:hypothetical protein